MGTFLIFGAKKVLGEGVGTSSALIIRCAE